MAMREWLESSGGKIAVAVLIVIAGVAVFFAVRSVFGPNEVERLINEAVFVDAENGKSFHYAVKKGDTLPIKSPYSGKNTGYPAELCYWTKDGKVKSEPTAVLLNSVIGKPGPTFCPDCGRLVRPRNPAPAAGMKPPPTQAEYNTGGGRGGEGD